MSNPFGQLPQVGNGRLFSTDPTTRPPTTPPDNTGGWAQTAQGWIKNGVQWIINNAGTWVPLVAGAGAAYEGAQAQGKANEFTQMAIDMAKGDYEQRGKFRDAAQGKLLNPSRPDLSAFRDAANPYAKTIPKVGGLASAPSPAPTVPTSLPTGAPLPAAPDPYSWRHALTTPAAPGSPDFSNRQGAAIDQGQARRKQELDWMMRTAGIQPVGQGFGGAR